MDEIVIDEQDLKEEAERLDMNYFITSAKTGENINDLFTNLTYMFLDSQIAAF